MSDSFGQWLRLRRKNLGLSQHELADEVGCSSALIRKIEADERRPSRQIALLLIEYLRQPHEQVALLLRAARERLQRDETDFGLPEYALSSEPLSPLTVREQDILKLIADDLPDSAIAERLNLKVSTIRWYVKQLYSKLGVHNREQAALYADKLAPIPAEESLEVLPANSSSAPPAYRLVNGLSQEFGKSYVGRETERGELTNLLRGRTRLCSIYGRSGIGKTALVCKVLGDLLDADNPPDGVVALTVTVSHISLSQVLSAFARLLDNTVAAQLAQFAQDRDATALEKAGALIDVLATGWYILLLDNLETLQHPQTGELLDADLQALFQVVLERSGLSILVTSRQQLSLGRIQLLSERRILLYDGLSEAVAVNLLRQIDPDGSIGLRDAPEADLRQCATITKGYPRALEAIAGILLEDPLLSVEMLYRDAVWLNNELSAILQQAISRLDSLAVQVIQALAVFPRAVPMMALAAVLDEVTDMAALRTAMSHLIRGFFVRYSRSDQHFSLHPLDREIAYSLIPATDGNFLSRNTLHRRAAAYFRQQRKPQAEWRTLDDVLPVIDEFEQQMALVEYDEAARLLLLIDRDYLWEWGQRTLLHSLHNRLSNSIRDGYLDRQHRRRVAWLHWSSDVEVAGRLFKAVLNDARAAEDRQSEADALDDLAQIERRQMRFMEGLHKHQEALQLYREIGDVRGQAEALGGMASVLAYFDPDSAVQPFREALEIHRALGSIASLVYTLNYLGVALNAVGDFETARSYLQESLALSQQHGIKEREAEAMLWLGVVALEEGDYETVADWGQRLMTRTNDSLSIHQRTFGENTGSRLFGTALYRLGDREKGLAYVHKAYTWTKQNWVPIPPVVSTSTGYSYLLLAQGHIGEAIAILEPIIPLAGYEIRFWAVYIVALLASGRSAEVMPLVQRVIAQVEQLPRQGRIPLWIQYQLTLLHTIADFLSGDDLAPRVVEFSHIIARVSAPGLVDEIRALLEIILRQPGGERLQPIHEVLAARRIAK